MFGCPVRLGVASVGFPLDETTNLNQEDIEEIDNDINIRHHTTPNDSYCLYV